MATHRTMPQAITTRDRVPGGLAPASRRARAHAGVLRPSEVAVLTAVALVLAVASCLPTPADGAPATAPSRAVRVESADTLWSIAQENPVAGESTAATVGRIRQLNGLDPSDQLQPGTFVLVPRADVADCALAQR